MDRRAEDARGRVLVVEDDPDLLGILGHVLEGAGFEVLTAGTAEAGLEALERHRPEVAIVDFKLPGTSGLEFIRRAHVVDEDVQCIAVTGQGSEKVAVSIMKAGATDYLVKPLDHVVVVESVRRAFEDRRVRTSRLYRGLSQDLAEKNAQLERQMVELNRRMSETSTLYEVGRILTSKLDLADVLSTVMRMAGELFAAQASTIRLLDATGQRLDLVAHAGLSDEYCRRGPIPVGSSAAGAAALSGEPVHIPDVEADPRFLKGDLARREGLRSLLSLPLKIRDHMIGVMTFYHAQAREYDAEELRFLTTFTATVSIAIDNARLYQEKSRLAITDGLTGLFNHKHFHESLTAEIGRARRYGHPLSLILVDIDNFKAYNDAWGHQSGDALLRVLADLLRRAARANDLVARYGGEEFAILLPQANKTEAFAFAERLCRTVERQRCEGEEVLPGGRLTVSIGVAAYPEDVLSAPALVQCADQALYRAKHQGRNQVQQWQNLH